VIILCGIPLLLNADANDDRYSGVSSFELLSKMDTNRLEGGKAFLIVGRKGGGRRSEGDADDDADDDDDDDDDDEGESAFFSSLPPPSGDSINSHDDLLLLTLPSVSYSPAPPSSYYHY